MLIGALASGFDIALTPFFPTLPPGLLPARDDGDGGEQAARRLECGPDAEEARHEQNGSSSRQQQRGALRPPWEALARPGPALGPWHPIHRRGLPHGPCRSGHHPIHERKGDCWDNAPIESFFRTLKTERVHHRLYATTTEARRDLFGYIEAFYNSHRLHSALGYIGPAEMERRSGLTPSTFRGDQIEKLALETVAQDELFVSCFVLLALRFRRATAEPVRPILLR